MKKGFTLIEMLVVIVVIGTLGAALIPRVVGVQARARDVNRTVDMKNLSTALGIYELDYGQYPGPELLGSNTNEDKLQLYASTDIILAQATVAQSTNLGGERYETTNSALTQGGNKEDTSSVIKEMEEFQSEEMSNIILKRKSDSAVRAKLDGTRSSEGVLTGIVRGGVKNIPTREKGDVMMSPITSFGDERLQKALLPYINTIPKDIGRGLSTNIGKEMGECDTGGDYYAYYADENIIVITSSKESQKGNTNNCIGELTSEGEGSYQSVSIFTQQGYSVYHNNIIDPSTLSTEEIVERLSQIKFEFQNLDLQGRSYQIDIERYERGLNDLVSMKEKEGDESEDNEEKITNNQNQIDSYSNELQGLKETAAGLVGDINMLQNKIKDLKRKGENVDELIDELNSIQSTLDEVNQNIEDIEATIMELEDYKKTLLSGSSILDDEIQNTQNKIDNLYASMATLENRYNDLNNEFEIYLDELKKRDRETDGDMAQEATELLEGATQATQGATQASAATQVESVPRKK